MWLEDKHVLVTGGTGQIGSFLVERLLAENVKVSVISRGQYPQNFLSPYIENKEISHIKWDLSRENNIISVKDMLKDVCALFHLSSVTVPVSTDFIGDALYTVDLNVKGTINLLRSLPNLEYICFASSMAVYGKPAYLPVDEHCPTEPLNPYGAAKLTTEKFLQIHSENKAIPISILRYSSVYGPRNMTNRAIPTFIKQVLKNEPPVVYGNGTVIRDYCYVSDIVDATLLAAQKKKNSVYNIGLGKGHTVKEILDIIIELRGEKVRPIYKEAPKDFDFIYDIAKAKKELEYEPRVYLKTGLAREIEWHKTLY